MKRILLTVLLLTVTSATWAEWVLMVESDAAFFYIDPDTIRKDGNHHRVWKLTDYKKRDPVHGYLSVRALYEYDCKREMVRILAYARYSERQAMGTLLDHGDATQWVHVPPSTIAGRDLRGVCAM